MRFRFLLSAEEKMIEAAIYYEMQVEGLGKNFLDIFRIEAAVAETAKNPKIWPEIKGDTEAADTTLPLLHPFRNLRKRSGHCCHYASEAKTPLLDR